jgi:hypothetical protein
MPTIKLIDERCVGEVVPITLTAHCSPLTAHRSPLTAHRSPLTAHRSPLTWGTVKALACSGVHALMGAQCTPSSSIILLSKLLVRMQCGEAVVIISRSLIEACPWYIGSAAKVAVQWAIACSAPNETQRIAAK